MPRRLPFVSSIPFYRVGTVLANKRYIFDVRWNQREGAWLFDISDAEGNIIQRGYRITLGAMIGHRQQDPRLPAGLFIASDLSNQSKEATFDDLGSRVNVYFFTLEELAALSVPVAEVAAGVSIGLHRLLPDSAVALASTVEPTAEDVTTGPTHSALFDPLTDYASIANASEVANVDGLDEFTIEFWWRPINVGGSLGLVTDFKAPNNMLCQLSSGDPRFAVRLAGGYEIISGTPSTAIATLTWYHLAYIWDGVNGEQRIYIHGGGMSDEKVAENLSAGTGAATTGAGDWTISSIDSGASQHSNGHFSQVRLWGKVRSLAEIQSDRETLLDGTETDLLAHWSLNNTWDDDVAGGVALTNSGGAFDAEVPF